MKYFIMLMILTSLVFAQDSASLTKEKKEINELKKELNSFYNKKEEEYKKRKKEVEDILKKIENEKRAVQSIYDKNIGILKDIKGEVLSKTTKVYNGMKPKIAASIFNKMIEDGKIEDVFDIILKLKDKKITLLMKFLSVEYASEITQMLQNYNIENGEK